MADNPHIGHRQRMRRKLFEYSRRVFDTYELLEVLLYYSVRISDTNPIAKGLLRRFGSLDGVLRADATELTECVGVGESSARLIRSVNLLHSTLLSEGEGAEWKIRERLLALFELLAADGKVYERLSREYQNPRFIFETDADTLSALIGDKWACLIILVSALLSRRITDGGTGLKCTDDGGVEKYLTGVFFGTPYETVYLLSFDKSDELTACDFVSEGTANASEIIPRKLLSIAKKRSAVSATVAHNHPFSDETPSDDDLITTERLRSILEGEGIRLNGHYTVAQHKTAKIPSLRQE